jgi:hypothetical protein
VYISTYQVLDFLCETLDFFGFVVQGADSQAERGGFGGSGR